MSNEIQMMSKTVLERVPQAGQGEMLPSDRIARSQRGVSPSGIRHPAIAVVFLLASCLHADTLVLKDGQAIAGKSFFRQGDALFASEGAPGTPLAEIVKVECEPSTVLKSAPSLLAMGRGSNVLPDVRAELKAAAVYGNLPGSSWPELNVLLAHILVAIGKDEEAATLVAEMQKSKNEDLVHDSQALRALIAARKGDHATAAPLAAQMLKDSTRPSTLAAASVALGLGYLEKKQFQGALKAFLELPVFLPDQTAFSGIAQLGVARAYFGLDDYDRAIATLEDLIKAQPGTPEVTIAQSLLPEWTRRRTAVKEATEP